MKFTSYNYSFKYGSMASLKPSPKKLNAKTITKIAIPGAIEIQGSVNKYCFPLTTMSPQLVEGGCAPIPRKLKLDSDKIDAGTFNVNKTINEEIQFGRICLNIITDFFTPIDIAGERLGTVFMYRKEHHYEIDDIILVEYGTTVVGLEMMRSVNEENAEETRKVSIVKSAISTLSFSELEAIQHIFDELDGSEGILVASKIADRVGITRSVIVNALRKFESAGVIESRSSGMKGTYIKVLNDVVFDELKKMKH